MYCPAFSQGDVSRPPAAVPSAPLSPLTIARLLRRWNAARTAEGNAQPALYAMLEPLGLAMLAPVFDALFCAGEAALGRAIQTDCGALLSPDERALAVLVLGPDACLVDCSDAFAHALGSARIMLELARKHLET